MNKKISTFLAGSLLAVCVGAVQAQDVDPAPVVPALCGAPAGLTGASFEAKESVNEKLYYFIQDADGNYLYLDNSNTAFQAQLVDDLTSLEEINQALWSIKPQISEDGGTTRFCLVNKATGLFFSFDPANATKTTEVTEESTYIGGAYPNWKWFESKYAGEDFETETPLSIVFSNADSTMILGSKNDGVYAYKYANDKTPAVDALELKLVKAGTYVLSAEDLNTKTNTKNVAYMQLDFGSDAKENNIFATPLQAQQLKVRSSASSGYDFVYNIDESKGFAEGFTKDVDDDYVILSTLENDQVSNKYLHVDTSYFASAGATYKMYNKISTTDKAASLVTRQCFKQIAKGLPLDAFRFKFTKNLANDSIWVQAMVEAVEMDRNADEPTVYNNADNGAYTSWSYANTLDTEAEKVWPAIDANTAADVQNGAGENLILSHCKLVDEQQKVITFYSCDGNRTKNLVNLLAYDGISKDYTTLPEGIYKVYVKSTDNKYFKPYVGLYASNSLCGEFNFSEVVKQDVEHMPTYQWVVEKVIKNGTMASVSPVKIMNREFGNGFGFYNEGIHQFVKREGLAANEYYYNGMVFVFNLIDPTTEYGYFNENTTADIAEQKTYNLTYLSGLAAEGANLQVGLDTTSDNVVLTVGQEGVAFSLVPVNSDNEEKYVAEKYGYANDLKKVAYKLEVENSSVLTDSEKRFVTAHYYGGSVKYILAKRADATIFYLKEQNCVDGTHYYALIEADAPVPNSLKSAPLIESYKVGVDDVTAQLIQECLCCNYGDLNCRTSSFALTEDTTPLYRRLGKTLETDELKDMDLNVAKIFRVNSTAKEYLYEDANSVYSKDKGINFLGIEGKGDAAKAAMTIDTAYVRKNTTMPQYMFVMGAVRHEAGWNCPFDEEHNTDAWKEANGVDHCPHAVQTEAYTTGRYLVNFADSVALPKGAGKDYIWNSRYTRLGFVDAKHIGDTLVIYRNGQVSHLSGDSIFLGDNKHNQETLALSAATSKGDSIHATHKNGIKNAVFALRLVNTDAADFLIETEGDKKIPSAGEGAWVAVKNGVPVVANYTSYEDAIRDAEIFNIEATDETPTSNDAISASEVSVVATNGAVIINGAQGKKVTISNVLGQAIANTVISSDNATIATPAGVVVVAVEGEAAVKAIVK
ncbi:DUF6383 domain-containing protein [uncultured Parabacteroides sp.]|jgi:hypothetical protein|uniref:DUF6383 domain-containing protein n=1 Tax=uncultured Parabacteroides sp. TaxID=512312 RepID=UPI0025EE93E6|nr:DUF6383 domain-containing protein [uncultured Parabacteroides sp.]